MNKYMKLVNYGYLAPDLIEYIRKTWDSDIKKGIIKILSDDCYEYVKADEYISMINYIKKYVDCYEYVNNIFRYLRDNRAFSKCPIYDWTVAYHFHSFIYEWYDILDIDIKREIAFKGGNIYYLVKYMVDNNKYDDFKFFIYKYDNKLYISIIKPDDERADYILSKEELYFIINIKKHINIEFDKKDHISNYIINIGLATNIIDFQKKYII